MKRDKVVQALKLLGAKVPQHQPRLGWIVCDCPQGPWRHDQGRSSPEVFGVRLEQGDPRCNCFSCGWHGRLGDLVLEMRARNQVDHQGTYPFGDVMQLIAEAESDIELDLDVPDVEELLFGAKTEAIEFPQWWLDSFVPVAEVPMAGTYLAQRAVSLQIAASLDLRWDSGQQRICFPIRDFKHRLRGLHGRAIQAEVKPRYRMYTYQGHNNPIHWLGESWVDLSKPIVVVEGPFDLASVFRVYRNVVSPLFSNPSVDKLLRMSDVVEWVSFYDRGTGGDTGRRKLDQVLTDQVLTHCIPPKHRKDPGEMEIAELVDSLGPHLVLDPIIA